MLPANQVFRVNDKRWRLLWCNKELACWIDIDDKLAWPSCIEMEELELLLLKGEAAVIDDPFLELTLWDVAVGSIYYKKREASWKLIQDTIEDPRLFSKEYRGKIVKSITENHCVTKQTVNRFLRRYWQRGMCKNALLPDYKNSGAAGIRRKPSVKKLGRPRTIRDGEGSNITSNIERIFRQAIEEYVLREKKVSIACAYSSSLRVLTAMDPELTLDRLPTEEQFRYFFKREYGLVDVLKKQLTPIEYDKDYRPLISTSTAETLGPGYRYQIDATIADIYLVSERDRSKIVGRPVVYFVIDVFSRMVAGMYVGFEGPSWVSAMMAVANTVENKVDYCRQFGISITEQEWPVHGLPNVILADKGELNGTKVEPFAASFGVTIENATARRGDAKGIVERYFNTIHEKFKPYFEGIVEPVTSKKRGGHDYRLDATMDLNRFTQMVIYCVLWHNNHRVLRVYDRCADMPGELPAIPIKLWHWGLANLIGKLRSANTDLVKINLLPHSKATVSDLGIRLFGNFYTCAEGIKKGWFHRKVDSRPKSVLVAYDPRKIDRIYLRPSDKLTEYWVCQLTDRSRRFLGMNFWDMWTIKRKERKADTNAKTAASLSEGELIERMELIAKAAAEDRPNLFGVSSASRTKGIKDNKQEEKDYERQRNAFIGELSENSDSADVIQLKSNKQDDYTYPDMIDVMFEDDSDEN